MNQFDIERLKSEILFLKIEVNSNYNSMSATDIQDIVDKRLSLKNELKRLYKLKDREEKIRKIKSMI